MDPQLTPSDAELLPMVRAVFDRRGGTVKQLLGYVMVELKGRANPAQVNRLIELVKREHEECAAAGAVGRNFR